MNISRPWSATKKANRAVYTGLTLAGMPIHCPIVEPGVANTAAATRLNANASHRLMRVRRSVIVQMVAGICLFQA